MSWQGSVIATFSTVGVDGGYTVTRATNAGYDPATGDPAAPVVTTFPLTDAVVTYSSGRQLKGAQIEGRHSEETILIITETRLYVSSPAYQADRLAYLGETYEVLRVEGPLRHSGATHYQAYAARLVAP